MASIKDIARELGLSVSTVSLALNDKPRVSKETRDLVKEKAKELKYVKNGIAADLQRKRTNIILLIVNDASRSFFSVIINQLQKATSNFGYDFLICPTYGDHNQTAKRFMQEHRADAVIVYTNTVSDELIRENAREDFPIVVLGRNVSGNNIYSFTFGNSDFLDTTDYLISQGHQKIAFVKGSSASLGTSRTLKGYKNSLSKNNISFNESLIFDAGGASFQHGYEVTKQILPLIQDKKIDAIQYSTDDIAIGGMMYLKDSGIQIPNDVSIVGRNNIPESKLVSLTTSGLTSDDYLFYESIVHFLVMMIERDENYQFVTKQLHDRLNNYHHESGLIIRETVKERN